MIVSTKAFSNAVSHALVAVAPRPAQPIMSGVKLDAADGYLTVSGFDGSTQATEIMHADGDLPVTLINGALLKDVVAKSRSETMALEVEDRYLRITAGRAKTRLQIMAADEYPKPLLTPEDGFTIDGTGWGVIARTVSHAAAKEDSIPLLTAVNFTVKDGQLTASATDRYRLAENTVSVDSKIEGTLTVSAKTVMDIARHLDTTATWEVRFSETLVAVNDGHSQIVRSLIDGEYPNVSKIYPEETAYEMTANRTDLSEAVSRATSLLDRNEPVLITIEPGSVTVDAGTGDIGAMTEALDCESNTEQPFTLRFNPSYLAEALSALNSENVKIGWDNTIHPTTINGEDAEHRQVVMPIRPK